VFKKIHLINFNENTLGIETQKATIFKPIIHNFNRLIARAGVALADTHRISIKVFVHPILAVSVPATAGIQQLI